MAKVEPQKIVEPQKSEVHDATDDAESSPAAIREIDATRDRPAMPHGEVRPSSVRLDAATIVRDDTDVGGPLVITSDDPDLNPPRVPSDPFPTDGTPEVDLPVEK